MKHVQTYALYESVAKRDLMKELKHALYETQTGKDLLSINKLTGMASESLKTWATFSYLKHRGQMVFPAVESKNIGLKNVQIGQPLPSYREEILWYWVYNLADGSGRDYSNGKDFSSVEDCLRSLWEDLVIHTCDEIFPDPSVRKEHVDLIRSNIELFKGHDIDDLKFLIRNLKDILSMQMKPNVANILRQRFPSVWQIVSDTPGITTLADLGELGF